MEQKPLFEKDAERMFGVPNEDLQEVELQEHRAMICLPEDAVEAEIRCKVYQDGDLISVSKKLKMSDLRAAFQKADDGYIDDDDRFVLTDKGMAYFEELNQSI